MSLHQVEWCFHTTAMVADYERTRDALQRIVGLRVYEDSRLPDPAIGRRGGQTWIGDNSIELGEPITPGGAVDRFVQRFGSHMSSIAVKVADMEGTLAFLAANDVPVMSLTNGVIAFTDPRATGGIVVEWFGGGSDEDPRWGHPMPPYAVEPLLDVTHMAFGGAVVADPQAAGERLAHLFGTRVTFSDPSAASGSPQVGVSMGDVTLALYPLPADEAESRRLWEHVYRKPQTSNLGVKVPDLAAALAALTGAGVPIVRHDERQIVLSPEATGGVIVVVVDELLPGDARLG